MERGTPLGLAVVMRGATPGQETKTVNGAEGTRRVGVSVPEPADGSGAESAEDDTSLPGAPKHGIEFADAPDGEHVASVAAADVNDIALGYEGCQVTRRVKERKVAGAARQRGEGGVETGDVIRRIAAGSGQETDGWVGGPGVLKNVTVKQEIVGLHREAAATHCDDLFVPQHLRGRKRTANGRE